MATDTPELVYTHSTVVTRDLEKRGDRLFAALPVLRKLGWTSEVDGDSVRVMAEGRELRLPIDRDGGKTMVNLSEAWSQLGAHAEWSETGVQTVLGQVLLVGIQEGDLIVESTLALRGRVFRLSNPDRIVADLVGAKLSLPPGQPLPPGVRAAQYEPSTVRIVLDGSLAPAAQLGDLASARSLRIRLSPGASHSEGGTVYADPASAEPSLAQVPPAPLDVIAAPLAALMSIETSGNLTETRVACVLSGSVAKLPVASYRSPTEVELFLPEVVLGPDFSPPVADPLGLVERLDVQGGEPDTSGVRVVFALRKPAAFELATAGTQVTLRLVRPAKADGTLRGKLIVVDAGHGGRDSGASQGGVKEKDLTLTIARSLSKQLIESGASVIMTRNNDSFVDLKERPAMANRAKADLFLSVHINSNKLANSRSGSITFYHAQEAVSRLLAQCIQAQLPAATGIPGIGIWSDTRIYRTGFAVLRYAQMPAVLLELGFINHQGDRARMTAKDFADKAAAAVVKGVRVFFGDEK